mmetsp:Transcript_3957/g.5358  ORF Transcript_3957/g.5358 Transcript_3957/m.5358 type:complete len:228 (-) Transcript_3957:217-900(-)|eukprot:CAMPEP_0116064894 /NCGR_PEP_ID=MMETSP0322-20121206/9393_1 /TAXON_ID=163516 /ORGANISM="Leptocylindrus danicus var. apora, Strain B651" /LENGTH=227 /DNA_ID=CAMNT_0003551013 /DNA_START=82 /DNA_END=765 /DNA_ORIENTATION=+
MTIVYALVSRGKDVLAEYTATSVTGNFPTVTRVLLGKIPSNTDTTMAYQYDAQYMFHYIVEGGLIFLSMSDEVNKHRTPLNFLNDIKTRFRARYTETQCHNAFAFGMNAEFSPVLSDVMTHYNSGSPLEDDQIGLVKGQIEEVKDVVVQNIEKVLERGEKIDLLVDKSSQLQETSFKFENSSRKLQRTFYWRKIKRRMLIGAGVCAALFVVVCAACGGLDFHRCTSD